MKIAVLTTKDQWFENYAINFSKELQCTLYFNHKDMKNHDIVFILSYHQIIPKEILSKNRHNIVIHASPLPKGKGWAPLFWQILEGKHEIIFSMFEAGIGIDDGSIYMQKTLELTGYELHDEIREKQAKLTIKMCQEFINNYKKYKTPIPQTGAESFYPKRTPKDSKLDINKTIKEQFNLLRIVDNENYPAYFEIDGYRYILKIELDKMGGVKLIDFVDLSFEEKKQVLSFRNHDEVKQWMYNSDKIELDEHLKFIKSLELNIQKQYLLVKKKNRFLGVIDFTKINYKKKECEFGLYANPFEKIAGVGRILEEICIKYTFNILKLKKLKLEVFEDNIQVRNLHKKYQFKETDQTIVNNKKVICMELINENR